MKTRRTVADYMARDLVTLGPETEINAAMLVLLRRRISGAPVVSGDGELVGVLSKKDCLRAALEGAYHHRPGGTVADYMSTKVETLDAYLDVFAACERFVASSSRRFPVLREGRLIGQISRADILKALIEHWS